MKNEWRSQENGSQTFISLESGKKSIVFFGVTAGLISIPFGSLSYNMMMGALYAPQVNVPIVIISIPIVIISLFMLLAGACSVILLFHNIYLVIDPQQIALHDSFLWKTLRKKTIKNSEIKEIRLGKDAIEIVGEKLVIEVAEELSEDAKKSLMAFIKSKVTQG